MLAMAESLQRGDKAGLVRKVDTGTVNALPKHSERTP